MKFVINKKKLIKPLQKINSIILINNEYPITSNILLKFKNHNIFLTSTNLELELTTKISLLNYNYNFSILVSGKKLLNVVRSFPKNSDITIIINNNNIHLTSYNINFSLNTMNANVFPKFIKEKNTTNIILSQKKLKNILHNTAFAMAKQDIRHYLNGMYITIQKNKIFSIATDGYRMALCNTLLDKNNQTISIIIPRKTIIELIKILQDDNILCKICIGLKMVILQINKYIIFSKLIDNEFPNYKNLFIKNFDTKITINRKILYDALIRASILTNQQCPGVKLSFKKKQCMLHAKNEHNEIIKERFEIHNITKEIELTMNIHYILDVINIIDDEFITIYLNNNTSSIYIQKIKEYHSFYIIMPLII